MFVFYINFHFYILDPPGPIDNSNILFVKGSTKQLRTSKYIVDFFAKLVSKEFFLNM